ncbi:MAG: hypothetical protein ACI39H_02620 [Lachnospiraceae bacterium]
MGLIKQKIHSQSGASFLFALLAFLVAAMVSITIVSAAVTSVRRVNSDREEQQEHLTLTSAAQLVRNGMESTEYIIEEITEEIISQGTGTTTDTTIQKSAIGMFATEMKTAVEHVDTYQSQYVSGADSGFELEITGAEMENVDVSFVMEAEAENKYKVIFTFVIKNSGETLFLTMNGVVDTGAPETSTSQDETGSKKTTTTTTTTITWNQPIINGLGG